VLDNEFSALAVGKGQPAAHEEFAARSCRA
jgi:hypothetical protein